MAKTQLIRVEQAPVETIELDAEDAVKAPPVLVRPLIWLGAAIALFLFGGFGAWASLAQITNGVVASGVISVEGNRLSVEHLEGGIVKEILVKEGTHVEKGQLLMRLDETQVQASIRIIKGRIASALALDARLVAEQRGDSEVTLPAGVTEAAKPDANGEGGLESADLQIEVFRARRDAIEGQLALLDDRIAQYEETKIGRGHEIAGAESQIALINEEIADLETLVKKGLARKPRLLALQREQARIQGMIGRGQAMIAEAEQAIGQAREEKLQLGRRQLAEVVELRRSNQDRIYDLRERLVAFEDQFSRLDVLAPTAGYVFELAHNTLGSVVKPGERLLEIVPDEVPLIVKAEVKPLDVDLVRPGLKAKVRLSAFSYRTTPAINGVVVKVSADRIIDRRSGVAKFVVDIDIEDDLAEKLPDIEVVAGMPADVIIETGNSTMLGYLLEPVLVSIERAFKE